MECSTSSKRTARVCVMCGKSFLPKSKTAQCCGWDCAKAKQMQTQTKPRDQECVQCGGVIDRRPKGQKDQMRFCSRRCTALWRHSQKPKEPKICKGCGEELADRGRIYCSERCGILVLSCRHCCKDFEGRSGATFCSAACRKGARRIDFYPGIVRTCPICTKSFSPLRRCQKRCACCIATQKKLAKKRYLKTPAGKDSKHDRNHRRRARQAGTGAVRVYRKQIYERDRWRCQLCGKKVNPDHKYPHLMSASLDHIIPLAQGGVHEPKNCQLVHFICNSIRRDQGTVQLRLFG